MCPSDKKLIKRNLKSLPKTYARDRKNKENIRRIHLFTCFSGSLTVEAAVVIPFTAAFLAAVLFFFQVMQIETEVQEALYYAGRMTAVESSTIENSTVLWGTAEILMQKELSSYSLPQKMVIGGNAGIVLSSSGFSDDLMDLKVSYIVKLPISFFSFKGINIVQHSCNHKWNGKDPEDEDGAEENGYVYYTDYGTVYHKSRDCSYLNLHIQSSDIYTISSLRSNNGSIYYPCPLCEAGQCTSGTVYYTTYGENYHTSLACSGLKRTVHVAQESEVSGLHACSKCGGE